MRAQQRDHTHNAEGESRHPFFLIAAMVRVFLFLGSFVIAFFAFLASLMFRLLIVPVVFGWINENVIFFEDSLSFCGCSS